MYVMEHTQSLAKGDSLEGSGHIFPQVGCISCVHAPWPTSEGGVTACFSMEKRILLSRQVKDLLVVTQKMDSWRASLNNLEDHLDQHPNRVVLSWSCFPFICSYTF
mmetsp:Transcript_4517/g.28711  ORF Transcript_4517/g.28711 Transcript_4517/m.28711 type:complete len:106 (-) Transcript_4517:457-774(-)